MEIRCLKSAFGVTDSEGREMPAVQTAKMICRCWQKVSLGQCSGANTNEPSQVEYRPAIAAKTLESELGALRKPASMYVVCSKLAVDDEAVSAACSPHSHNSLLMRRSILPTC